MLQREFQWESGCPWGLISVLHLQLSMHTQLVVPQVSLHSAPSSFIFHLKIREKLQESYKINNAAIKAIRATNQV